MQNVKKIWNFKASNFEFYEPSLVTFQETVKWPRNNMKPNVKREKLIRDEALIVNYF